MLFGIAITGIDRDSAYAQTLADIRLVQEAAHHVTGPRQYDGRPLSLQAALDAVLGNNPDVIALRAQLPVVRERPTQARALMPPMLEGTIWQWPINTVNPANTNMYMFMLSQELPGRGKRALHAAVADKDVTQAERDVAIRERDVVNEVKHAYASLFIARQAVDVQLASVDLLRQLADVSQAKYAAGRSSQQDVLKAVVELSKLHNDILLLDEQAKIASARLNILMNRAPETPIGPLDDGRGPLTLPASADLQRLAIDRNPDLQRARTDIERAEAELASAKRAYAPDFTVQAGYMLMPNQTDGVLARMGVTWPRAPWSRGKIDAHVAEQTAAVEVAKARERAMKNGVRLAVHEAYVHAKAAQDRAALLQTTILPQSQQTLEVSRIAYQTNRVDFQAVIDNERMVLDARLAYVRALSDLSQATADLERAVGTDLPPNASVAVVSREGQ